MIRAERVLVHPNVPYYQALAARLRTLGVPTGYFSGFAGRYWLSVGGRIWLDENSHPMLYPAVLYALDGAFVLEDA
jgi:hypothetical protein